MTIPEGVCIGAMIDGRPRLNRQKAVQ